MDRLFPSVIMTYMSCCAPAFAANNFVYVRGFVVASMLLGGARHCVTNVARVCFFVERHICSWERFLSQYQWELPAVQERVVALLREHLADQLLVQGAYLAWLDTTLVSKVKGRMPGVQKWHDHSGNPDRGESLVGHHWALAGLISATVVASRVTPVCWPLLANLISGQPNPWGFVVSPEGVARVMTFWDAGCPLVTQLPLMLGQRPLRVVADAYFCNAPFINWMLSLPVHVITRMRWDAVGWDDPQPEPPLPPGQKKRGRPRTNPRKGKRWKIADLPPVFPWHTVTISIYGKLRRLRVVTRDLWIRDVTPQKVRVVVINTRGKSVILLSTDLSLSPLAIIQLYAWRFPAELGMRDLKQHFGLGDYQCTSLLALSRFVALTLVSFCLWRLALLTDLNAPWLHCPESTVPLSFARLSRAVRRFLVRQLFLKSAPEADWQNSLTAPEEVMRLIV